MKRAATTKMTMWLATLNLSELFQYSRIVTIRKLIEQQTKTVMLANASDEYVFQVIEPPVAPELKSEPKRALICVLGTLLGGVLAMVFVLIRHYSRSEAVVK